LSATSPSFWLQKSTCTTAGLTILGGFFFHYFSLSSNDGTVTSARFEYG
jgi:hypothetical protein